MVLSVCRQFCLCALGMLASCTSLYAVLQHRLTTPSCKAPRQCAVLHSIQNVCKPSRDNQSRHLCFAIKSYVHGQDMLQGARSRRSRAGLGSKLRGSSDSETTLLSVITSRISLILLLVSHAATHSMTHTGILTAYIPSSEGLHSDQRLILCCEHLHFE